MTYNFQQEQITSPKIAMLRSTAHDSGTPRKADWSSSVNKEYGGISNLSISGSSITLPPGEYLCYGHALGSLTGSDNYWLEGGSTPTVHQRGDTGEHSGGMVTSGPSTSFIHVKSTSNTTLQLAYEGTTGIISDQAHCIIIQLRSFA
jgi:hypothetical protein